MGRIKVIPYSATGTKSGVSISLNEARGGQQYVTISLTLQAQNDFFGGPLDPTVDAIDIQLFDDPKAIHVMGLSLASLEDADATAFAASMRGSIRARLVPWTPVAKGKRPAAQMQVVHRDPGKSVTVKLPEWARPPARKVGQGKPIFES